MMKSIRQLATAIGLLLLLSIFGSTVIGSTRWSKSHKKHKTNAPVISKDTFAPSCTHPKYPSPPPKKSLGIDNKCGVEGAGGDEAEQNSVKNNFCAGGTAKTITIAGLQKLQQKVEKNPAINFGSKGPTSDRAPLRKLGEGKLVTLKAYVLIARQEGGESVNCKDDVPDDPPFHDIHISLVDSQNLSQPADKKAVLDAKECTGVVAEMSPHHRPDEWTEANMRKVMAAQVLVRVTGQLFFDSSHVPCSGGAGVGHNPKRISLWEIHPIYKFEVCVSGCTGTGKWLALDQWAAQQ